MPPLGLYATPDLLHCTAFHCFAFAGDAKIYSYWGASKSLDNDADYPSGTNTPHRRNQIEIQMEQNALLELILG